MCGEAWRRGGAWRKWGSMAYVGEHGVVIRAFDLYWGGIRFESLSTHDCWALSKSFIPSLVVWSVKKITHLAEKAKIKRATVSKSDICDLEQVTLKPQLQAPLLDHLAAKMIP